MGARVRVEYFSSGQELGLYRLVQRYKHRYLSSPYPLTLIPCLYAFTLTLAFGPAFPRAAGAIFSAAIWPALLPRQS